jgi:hypothetical protein
MSTIVIEQREKDKRISAILTIVFHILLVLLFLYFGLHQPNPLPEEQGIELAFEDAGGLSGGDPDPNPGSPQESATPVTSPSQPEDVATDEASEVEMPKPVKPQPNPPKPETPKPPKPNPNALFNPSTNPTMNPSTGPPGGNNAPGTQPGGGGIGDFSGKGFNGRLEGRGLAGGPSFRKDHTEACTVAVNIIVDRNGKVIEAHSTLSKPTTTVSTGMHNLAERYAKEITFTAKPDAPARQQGQVVFTFTLE